MRQVRIAMAQTNTTVGDLEGNTTKTIEAIQRAKEENIDIVTFPELTITGYPPQDLLLKPQFLTDNRDMLDRIIDHINDNPAHLFLIIGNQGQFPWKLF